MVQLNLAYQGVPLDQARAALLMVHGRGASAADILTLASELEAGLPDSQLAFVAPQAPGNTWYPYPFMSPIQQNEPHLSDALQTLADALASLEKAGLPPEKVVLLGFSQGACLATEFAARNARRYAGIAGLSGGLIGPDGTPRDYQGSLQGTPVFLGCSDVDPHIPKERVLETARVLQALGGSVTTRLYAGMGHTVNEDELEFLRQMVKSL
jgi:phospholipase/carboxylesterase